MQIAYIGHKRCNVASRSYISVSLIADTDTTRGRPAVISKALVMILFSLLARTKDGAILVEACVAGLQGVSCVIATR